MLQLLADSHRFDQAVDFGQTLLSSRDRHGDEVGEASLGVFEHLERRQTLVAAEKSHE